MMKIILILVVMCSLTGCQALEVLKIDNTFEDEFTQAISVEDPEELMVVINSFNEFRELDENVDGFELESFLGYLADTQDIDLERQELLELLEGIPGFESVDDMVVDVAEMNSILIDTLNDLGDIVVSLDQDSMVGLQDFTKLARDINSRVPGIQRGLMETARYLNNIRQELQANVK